MFGIDIGGTKCTVTKADPTGRPDEVRRFQTAGPGETLERIGEAIEALGPDESPFFGISCGSPLDESAGVILSPPNLPGWDKVRICEFLTGRFGGRAWLMNDANAGVLAEWRFGAGRGSDDVVFVTHGTGFGAGIVSGGRLVTGVDGHAGEIGHVRLTEEGPDGYGKSGSVEGWCSGGGIARRAGDLAARGELSDRWAHADAKAIIEAARAGNAEAMRVVRESARQLGRALAILIDLFNPQTIVLGSLYVRAADLLDKPMREALAGEALPHALKTCSIVPAQLGETLPEHQALAVAMYHTEPVRPLPPFDHSLAATAIDELADRQNLPDDCRESVSETVNALVDCFARDRAAFLCGNGGSAADAEHWAGELLKSFETTRPAPDLPGLPADLANRLQQGLRAIPLTGFTPARSAILNDSGAELDCAQLLSALGRSGDVLVAISTSGNAANVCHAARVARAMGLTVVALTGPDGGTLAGLSDVHVPAPGTTTADVQENHLPIYHAICRAVERGFFGHP